MRRSASSAERGWALPLLLKGWRSPLGLSQLDCHQSLISTSRQLPVADVTHHLSSTTELVRKDGVHPTSLGARQKMQKLSASFSRITRAMMGHESVIRTLEGNQGLSPTPLVGSGMAKSSKSVDIRNVFSVSPAYTSDREGDGSWTWVP